MVLSNLLQQGSLKLIATQIMKVAITLRIKILSKVSKIPLILFLFCSIIFICKPP